MRNKVLMFVLGCAIVAILIGMALPALDAIRRDLIRFEDTTVKPKESPAFAYIVVFEEFPHDAPSFGRSIPERMQNASINLSRKIQSLIVQGYKPYGPLTVVDFYMIQPMIKN